MKLSTFTVLAVSCLKPAFALSGDQIVLRDGFDGSGEDGGRPVNVAIIGRSPIMFPRWRLANK